MIPRFLVPTLVSIRTFSIVSSGLGEEIGEWMRGCLSPFGGIKKHNISPPLGHEDAYEIPAEIVDEFNTYIKNLEVSNR